MGTTNTELAKQLKHLSDKMDKFIVQYHDDMHGDSSLSNGERGVIGNIRWLKDQWTESPSFLKLMKDNPAKTLGIIIVGIPTLFGLLFTFFSIPQVNNWLMALFGIPMP
jgi:hypothetical protein